MDCGYSGSRCCEQDHSLLGFGTYACGRPYVAARALNDYYAYNVYPQTQTSPTECGDLPAGHLRYVSEALCGSVLSRGCTPTDAWCQVTGEPCPQLAVGCWLGCSPVGVDCIPTAPCSTVLGDCLAYARSEAQSSADWISSLDPPMPARRVPLDSSSPTERSGTEDLATPTITVIGPWSTPTIPAQHAHVDGIASQSIDAPPIDHDAISLFPGECVVEIEETFCPVRMPAETVPAIHRPAQHVATTPAVTGRDVDTPGVGSVPVGPIVIPGQQLPFANGGLWVTYGADLHGWLQLSGGSVGPFGGGGFVLCRAGCGTPGTPSAGQSHSVTLGAQYGTKGWTVHV